jgi:pimeloyl-ACP methyl ester carboxylesterase
LPISIQVDAQVITPDLQDQTKWIVVNRTAQPVTEEGKKGIRLSETPNDGLMILKDVEFADRIIEFDVKGKNVLQQSFVGLAFHGVDTNKYAYGNNPEAGKYFDAGGVKLYYEIYGKGDPILMLHGGVYGYISEFEYLIPKLAENHQVICLATRGHGKSEIGDQPYTYKQRAEDAYKLLKHLNIDKAIVLGFSDGAYSAYKMAAMYPQAVIKLIAMGAGDRAKDPKREPATYSEASLMKSSATYFGPLKKLMPEPERWNESLTMLNELYNNDFISKETFDKIECPVLVMAGDKDNYSSVDKVVACYKQIPKASLSIIPGCGHVIFYCNFPAVWEAMKGFVNNDTVRK